MAPRPPHPVKTDDGRVRPGRRPWIAAIAVAFLADAAAIAWVLAVSLLTVGATVTATNWCLPSFMYGLLHGRQAGEAPG